ncbi:hypothetical protein OAX29_00210 [bacterium]|jgi:(S)-2-hydroxyglutarate dehydrogenase|nr:hypothetical protein [bacterium]
MQIKLHRILAFHRNLAQLINKKNKKLEMDFVLESDEKSIHILNAVSPVFTCSIPFSKFVVDKIEVLIKKEVK